jgi:hypothetical protein
MIDFYSRRAVEDVIRGTNRRFSHKWPNLRGFSAREVLQRAPIGGGEAVTEFEVTDFGRLGHEYWMRRRSRILAGPQAFRGAIEPLSCVCCWRPCRFGLVRPLLCGKGDCLDFH